MTARAAPLYDRRGVRRIFLASTVAWAAGCAASAQHVPPPGPDAAAEAARAQQLAALEEESARRAERIRQLEGQLALTRAEVEDLRHAPAPLESTVRIGGGGGSVEPVTAGGWVDRDGVEVSADDVAMDDFGEAEAREESSGPRPLLRLYGSPAVPLDGVGAYGAGPRPIALPLPGTAPAFDPAAPRIAAPAPAPIPAPLPTYAPALPPAAPVAPAPAPAAPGPSAAVAQYRIALDHLRSQRLAEAASAFAAFLDANPGHAYADNARYWRGEALYAMRRYPEAIREFERVVREHPRGNKVPDALLKIGLCHRRMGDAARARAYFRRVRSEHPDSVAARLATEEDAS